MWVRHKLDSHVHLQCFNRRQRLHKLVLKKNLNINEELLLDNLIKLFLRDYFYNYIFTKRNWVISWSFDRHDMTHLKLVPFLLHTKNVKFLQYKIKTNTEFLFFGQQIGSSILHSKMISLQYELLWEIETRDLKFLLYIIYSSASLLLSSNYHTWPGLLDQSQFAVWGHSALC